MVPEQIINFILSYGYFAIFLIIFLESMGLPLPGETVLISASIFAGSTHQLDLLYVLFASASGAILGDSAGYWIGRRFGFPFFLRYGHHIHLTPDRLKIGQYLFWRYGGSIVFFGRFVAFLRIFAAALAGVNHYSWKRFLFYNASGGLIWTLVFGVGAYFFGHLIERVSTPVALILGLSALGAMVLCSLGFRRYEKQLQVKADLFLPDFPQKPGF